MAQPPTGNPAFFGQKVSKPGVNVAKAGPTDLVYSNDYSTTTYYDANNSRILLGQLPDNTYGIWISETGQDVTTATVSQLILDSGAPPFKIILTDSVDVVVSNAGGAGFSDYFLETTDTDVTHNLGFEPILFVVLSGFSGSLNVGLGTPLPLSSYNATADVLASGGITVISLPVLTLYVSITKSDANSFRITTDVSSNAGLTFYNQTYTYTYYLLQATAVPTG